MLYVPLSTSTNVLPFEGKVLANASRLVATLRQCDDIVKHEAPGLAPKEQDQLLRVYASRLAGVSTSPQALAHAFREGEVTAAALLRFKGNSFRDVSYALILATLPKDLIVPTVVSYIESCIQEREGKYSTVQQERSGSELG